MSKKVKEKTDIELQDFFKRCVHLIILSPKILSQQCGNRDPIVVTMETMVTTATMKNLGRKTQFDVLKLPKMDRKLKKCGKKCQKNSLFPFFSQNPTKTSKN